MNREVHVRFCESVGVRFQRATRPMMESFFGTLKRECIDGIVYESMDAARRAIFEYIEAWYNRRRLHSSLGYVSPVAFEEHVA